MPLNSSYQHFNGQGDESARFFSVNSMPIVFNLLSDPFAAGAGTSDSNPLPNITGVYSPGFGDPDARLLLVGLAPAAHGANRTGRVFTGDGSGDFLMAALHRAGFASLGTSRRPDDGLELRDAYITAAVHCAPPANKPAPEELARCLGHLEAELRALPRVRVVVALGRIAFDAYLRALKQRNIVLRPKPAFGHAAVHRLPNGQVLIGCFHPSRQNTNTGKLTAAMMDVAFQRAVRMLGPQPGSAT